MEPYAFTTTIAIYVYNTIIRIHLPKGGDVGKVTGSVDGFVGVIVGLVGAIGVICFVIQYNLR